MARLVQLVPKGILAQLGHKAALVQRGLLALRARLLLLLDQLGQRVQQVIRVLQALRGQLDQLDLRDLLGRKVPKAILAPQDQQDQQDQQVLPGLLGPQDQLDLRAQRVLQAQLVLPGQQVPLEPQVRQVQLAPAALTQAQRVKLRITHQAEQHFPEREHLPN